MVAIPMSVDFAIVLMYVAWTIGAMVIVAIMILALDICAEAIAQCRKSRTNSIVMCQTKF